MGIALSLALFFVIWWTLLFAVLPFWVRTQGEAGEVVPGTPASAPLAPRLARVFLVNTALSVLVFALVFAAVEFNVLDLEDRSSTAGGPPAATKRP